MAIYGLFDEYSANPISLKNINEIFSFFFALNISFTLLAFFFLFKNVCTALDVLFNES